MDFLLLLKTCIMGLVEGITEFLPISSTGHLILAGDLLNFLSKDKRDVFEIFIQMGAILAVIWAYHERLAQKVRGLRYRADDQRFFINLLLAFIPAAILGKLFSETIKQHLFHPVPVATAFIVGGLIILWAERRQHQVRVQEVEDLRGRDALKVGLLQCLALIPGTSRSGASIIGGLFLGLSRKAATEFSFFLGIPTLGAASLYSLYKQRHLLDKHDVWIFALGFVVSFMFALIAIRALIRFVANHDFTAFAWYRIGFGLVVLATDYWALVSWSHAG